MRYGGRPKKRILRILFKLWRVWRRNPDLRLAQLISNCHSMTKTTVNPYYTEDTEIEAALDLYLTMERMK